MQENNNDMFLDWYDSIESDGQEFILLPDGEYNFTVTNFERGRFPGGAKVPPCNKATITVQVDSKEGVATVKFDLLLYKSLEWKLSAFFRSIGQKKHGEKLSMDWNKVVGSKGRGYFKQKTYTNQSREDRTYNDLDRFIDYDQANFIDDLPF